MTCQKSPEKGVKRMGPREIKRNEIKRNGINQNEINQNEINQNEMKRNEMKQDRKIQQGVKKHGMKHQTIDWNIEQQKTEEFELNEQNFKEIMNRINLNEKEKIINCIILQQRTENRIFLYSKQIAAAIIIGIISLISITTYAAVDAYREYMSKMSEEEISARYEEIQIGQKEADTFSRPLTEQERQRLDYLMNEYQKGLCFPEESMERVGSIEFDETKTDKPFYDFENAVFYIPERELTDEELLQIVDVWEKANYSLAAGNATDDRKELNEEEIIGQAKEVMKQQKQEVEESDEDKIRNFTEKLMSSKLLSGCTKEHAESGIQSGYSENFSMDDYEFDVCFYGKNNPKYLISLENANEKYSVFFTADSSPDELTVYSIRHSLKGNSFEETSKYTKEEIRKTIENDLADMPSFFSEYIGIENSIIKKEIYSEIYLVLTDDKGNRYRILINPDTGKIAEFLTYEEGKYDDIDLSGELLN